MMHRLAMVPLALAAVAIAASFAASAEPRPGYIDPAPVLNAATKAIGADRIRCIAASGTITGGRVGQQRLIQAGGEWPQDMLNNFTREMDWQSGAMRETFDRTPGQTPASFKYGTGWFDGTPVQRESHQSFAVRGGVAWHRDGGAGADRPIDPEIAEHWQLDLWLNPVGFLKAAQLPGANPVATWRWELGESGRDGPTVHPEKVRVVSITVMGKYRVDATINARDLIQRIHTRVANPVLGDLNVEQEFADEYYADLGQGMRFPTHWHSHQGYDDNSNHLTGSSGHNAFRGTLETIRVNECPTIAVPKNVPAPPDPARVDVRPLAKDIYLLGGSTHNSVAIGMRDYVVVVEAPLSEERSLAVIDRIVQLFPDKPIRYLVNTHQHFDHIGGLRTYLHIGATILTHAKNQDFYDREVANYVAHTVKPDLVSTMPPTELAEGYMFEDVRENYTIGDGDRLIYLNYVQPLAHADGMLMVTLPHEKLLIEADLLDNQEGAPVDAAGVQTLRSMIQRLGYDIETVVPIHGQPVAWPAI